MACLAGESLTPDPLPVGRLEERPSLDGLWGGEVR
jgi:hypothetical protein